MKKLLLLLLLTLGFIGSANAEINTISDVFQIFPALWVGVKFYFYLPGGLVVTALYNTSLGQFFELSRYGEVIITILALVYWVGGLFSAFSISDYLYKLEKSRKNTVLKKIEDNIFMVWLFLPPLIAFIVTLFNREFLDLFSLIVSLPRFSNF